MAVAFIAFLAAPITARSLTPLVVLHLPLPGGAEVRQELSGPEAVQGLESEVLLSGR